MACPPRRLPRRPCTSVIAACVSTLSSAVLGAADMDGRGVEINLLPANVDEFADPQCMPEGHEDQQSIAHRVAAVSGGGEQAIDLALGQVLALPVIGVLPDRRELSAFQPAKPVTAQPYSLANSPINDLDCRHIADSCKAAWEPALGFCVIRHAFATRRSRLARLSDVDTGASDSGITHAICEGPCFRDPQRVRPSRERAWRESRDPHQRHSGDGGARLARRIPWHSDLDPGPRRKVASLNREICAEVGSSPAVLVPAFTAWQPTRWCHKGDDDQRELRPSLPQAAPRRIAR
jgi:hypothetical protein